VGFLAVFYLIDVLKENSIKMFRLWYNSIQFKILIEEN